MLVNVKFSHDVEDSVCGLGYETLAKTSRINSIKKMLEARERDKVTLSQYFSDKRRISFPTNKSRIVPMTFVGEEFLDEINLSSS